ncbi:MAG: DUF262 domain-containing HNH endonuclease family protein [Pseudomonadota bacterium]
MFNRLETTSLTVSEVLSASRTYAIPAYQRPYAWSSKQISQLFEDVSAAAGLDEPSASEADYFLGNLIFLRESQRAANGVEQAVVTGGAPPRLDIVDGQQRLVTLTILLAVLRDAETDQAHRVALDDLLFAPLNPAASRVEVQKREMIPRLELRENDQLFFATHIQNMHGTQITPVPNNALGQPHRTLSDAKALLTDVVGKLEPHERRQLVEYIKTRCHVVAIVTEDLDKAHKLFSVINDTGLKLQRNQILKAEVLRAAPKARASEIQDLWDQTERELGPRFEDLFSHIRTAYGIKRPQIIKAIRDLIEQLGGAEPFVRQALLPLAKAYRLILSSDQASNSLGEETKTLLLKMRRLNGEDWIPAAMLAVIQAEDEPDVCHRTLLEIDRFAHMLRLMCLGAGRRQTRMAKVCTALQSDDGFRADPHPVFGISKEETRLIAHHLRDLYGRNPQACKLVLMRLNDEMAGTVVKLPSVEFSVEHVLPQRPKSTSDWRNVFPNAEQRQACTTSLGNLVLVTPSQNSRARNEEFSTKRTIYNQPEKDREVLTITRDAISSGNWDAATIATREQRLLSMLTELWRLELPGLTQNPRLAHADSAPSMNVATPTTTQATSA